MGDSRELTLWSVSVKGRTRSGQENAEDMSWDVIPIPSLPRKLMRQTNDTQARG